MTGAVHVWAITDGTFSETPLAQAPAGSDLLSLSLSGSAGAYVALIGFGGTVVRDTLYGTSTVLVSLLPPGNPSYAISLGPGGDRAIRIDGNGQSSELSSVQPATAGSVITIPVPSSIPMAPDWDVQATVFAANASGHGFHAHTYPASVSALIPADRGTPLPLSGRAVAVVSGVGEPWRPAQMPESMRPSSFQLGRSPKGLVALVDMAGASAMPAEWSGRPVKNETVSVAAQLQDGSTELILWDARTGRAVAVDSVHREPRTADVTKSGRELRFDLNSLPLALEDNTRLYAESELTDDAQNGAQVVSSAEPVGCIAPAGVTLALSRNSPVIPDDAFLLGSMGGGAVLLAICWLVVRRSRPAVPGSAEAISAPPSLSRQLAMVEKVKAAWMRRTAGRTPTAAEQRALEHLNRLETVAKRVQNLRQEGASSDELAQLEAELQSLRLDS